ncbi:MAG: hypothetical protein JO101_07665 [Candidatus Eremiobacteraeota bacterium]|nr:hypothetical protein [Candidatus Eremiobacteraeota bacterium]
MKPGVKVDLKPPPTLRVPDPVYVCIRETGEIVTISEARDRYRHARWSIPVKRPTDPIQFLG